MFSNFSLSDLKTSYKNGDMFDALKNAAQAVGGDKLKEMGNSVIESQVRPKVLAKATEQLNEFQENSLKELPSALKQRIMSLAQMGGGGADGGSRDIPSHDESEGGERGLPIAMAAPLFHKLFLGSPENQGRLDAMLQKVVEAARPGLLSATSGLDAKATDKALHELKVQLHLEKEEESSREPDDADYRDLWPTLEGEGEGSRGVLPSSDAILQRAQKSIRGLNRGILPKIMNEVPGILHSCLNSVAGSSLTAATQSLKGKFGFLDTMLSQADSHMGAVQSKAVDEASKAIWNHSGTKKTFAQHLIGALVQFETKVLGELKEGLKLIPQI